MHLRSLIGFFFLLASMAYAQVQGTGSRPARDLSTYDNRPRVQAVRLAENETISVDGKLEEDVWQRAVPAGNFTQQDPDSGTPATERTEVRFVLSKDTLRRSSKPTSQSIRILRKPKSTSAGSTSPAFF